MLIQNLKDCTEHLETLACWDYGHWGFRRHGITLNNTIEFYKDACQNINYHIPVLIDTTRNLPAGMCTLMPIDPFAPEQSNYHYFLVSLYTQERYRGQGWACKLIDYAENYAQDRKEDGLYCNTRNAAALFLKKKWQIIDVLQDKPLEKPLNFMGKRFNDDRA